MCGIAGIYAADGRPIDRVQLAAMTNRLEHRGPDDVGLWTAPGIGLGHRRLAIRDVSALGHQPMSDPAGQVTVSYNGEIYNDRALRRELEDEFGVCFRSSCDAEVLPYGYLAWGPGLFERLEGMYAIALWDARTRQLHLARDPVGIKPLFYSWTSGVLRFGSELKALLATPQQPRTINAVNLHRFVNQGYPGPADTLLNDTYQVPPGAIVTADRAGVSVRRWWRIQRSGELRSMPEAIEAFVPLWNRVVADTLASDVPLGVLQSGGIDSSLVAAAASRSTSALPLFTVAFGESDLDESRLAGAVAHAIGLPHSVVPFAGDQQPSATLDAVVDHSDGQLADESLMPLYLLAQQVRRHVKVVLTGDGGDELFGGYPTYRATRVAEIVRPLVPARLSAAAGQWAYGLNAGASSRLPLSAVASRFLLGLACGGRNAHAHWRRRLPHFLANRVYGPPLQSITTSPLDQYEALVQDSGGSIIDRALIADQAYHLPAGLLLKTDSMTMAHGLEARVPLLDRRIVEFAGRCDTSLLTGWTGHPKKILREALSRYGLPVDVTRAAKRGFNAPLAKLLRGALRERAEQVFGRDKDVFEPYFLPRGVDALWREHVAARADHAYALWPLLVFGIWRKQLGA